MPKTKISEYSATNSSNTDIEGINIDEGCAPSGINNAIRELMVHLKEFQTGASGDAFTFAGGTLMSGTNTISGAAIISGNINSSGTNTFSGSNVMSFSGGSSASPSIYFASDTNTGIFSPAADTIAFTEGGVESMRIDASGNMGLGVTPSATWSSSARAIQLGGFNSIFGYTNNVFRLANNAIFTASNETYGASSIGATYYQQYNGEHSWHTAPSGTAGNTITFTERARITSGGAFCLNTTATGLQTARSMSFLTTGGSIQYISHSTADASGDSYVEFGYNGTKIGSITQNGTTAVAYNTSSDYRLKENIAPMTGALATVSALKPCTYTWKADGSVGQGFIAHELQAVVPDAVTGEKDATEIRQVEVSPAVPATYDDEGNELTPAVEAVYEQREVPKYQGVDTSFLVATLTAAIQELKAELDATKAEVAALKAGNGN